MRDYTKEIYRDKEAPEALPTENVCRLLDKVTTLVSRLERHDENDDFVIGDLYGAIDNFRTSIGLPTLDEQDDLDGKND